MSPRQQRLLPWFSLLVVYLVWGSTYLAIRLVVREMPPWSAAACRFLIAGLVMAVVAFFTDRAHGRPSLKQILEYSLVGVLLLSVGNALVMWSEKTVPSGIAALIVATVPLWFTLLDGLRPGGQPWTVRVWLGTVIGLAGVALVARPEGALDPAHLWGIVALQVASLSWTAGSLFAQSRPKKLPIFTASAVEMIAGALVLLLESALAGEDWGQLTGASAQAWLSLGYLIIFGSLIGFTAFAYCLNELPASTVGTYAYVNPVVAVALGALILGEPLGPGLLSGAVLILGSVLLTTRRRKAPAAVADR